MPGWEVKPEQLVRDVLTAAMETSPTAAIESPH